MNLRTCRLTSMESQGQRWVSNQISVSNRTLDWSPWFEVTQEVEKEHLVNDGHSNSWASRHPANIPLVCLLLTATMTIAFAVAAWIGYARSGATGIAAAAIAGFVCWGGGMIAVMLVAIFRNRQQVVNGALLGMLIRMALPLIVGVAFLQSGGPLADAGVFEMILGYYLVGLVVETLLAVWLIESSQQPAKAP